ncbi:MAG: hypothetical protein KDK40_00200 [Chlamydiia bacterium]|nr:hypothetical protein [Chlamydiia bacterium]
MVRLSKQARRRAVSPKACHANLAKKTGAFASTPAKGYKEHANALAGETGQQIFIGKVKNAKEG